MRLKDWTNRIAAGLGLLGLSLSFAVPAYVSQSTLFSAIAVTLALMGITVLGIDLWSRRNVAVGVEARTDYLSHILTTSEHIFISGFDKRKFAVVRVTNTGSKNLKKVVARCQFDRGAEEYGTWSLDSGDQFTAGGGHKANLDVGDSRYLVVAQGFGADKLWARLPRQEPFRWPPRATDMKGVVSYVDVSGQVLSIPGNPIITVRLTSKDLQRFIRRFQLDFDGDEPRITPWRVKPLHQPSVVEQLHEWERSVDEAQASAAERWDDFVMAAGETVSKFRAMRGGESPPPAQKWETFKRTAAHASRSATRLPEPYNEQARALVRPFLDLEYGNLESLETCVTAANELQSFILKHQTGVQLEPPPGVL